MTEKPYYYDRALDKIKNRETGDDYWFLCDIVDLLNEQDTEIQRLKLIINGLNYALKNIRQIDVEIDLNECGDVE